MNSSPANFVQRFLPLRLPRVCVAVTASDPAQLLDVELQTALKCKGEQLQKLRSRAALILSFHDFHGTKKLPETLEKMRNYPADFYKVVSTATTLTDNVTMMK